MIYIFSQASWMCVWFVCKYNNAPHKAQMWLSLLLVSHFWWNHNKDIIHWLQLNQAYLKWGGNIDHIWHNAFACRKPTKPHNDDARLFDHFLCALCISADKEKYTPCYESCVDHAVMIFFGATRYVILTVIILVPQLLSWSLKYRNP